MKKKSWKLRLNRETVRDLESGNLKGVAGGATANPTRCNPLSGCFSCVDCGGSFACETIRTCPP